ncbi:hypothetical protein ABK040_003818 [Willaertia magna]
MSFVFHAIPTSTTATTSLPHHHHPNSNHHPTITITTTNSQSTTNNNNNSNITNHMNVKSNNSPPNSHHPLSSSNGKDVSSNVDDNYDNANDNNYCNNNSSSTQFNKFYNFTTPSTSSSSSSSFSFYSTNINNIITNENYTNNQLNNSFNNKYISSQPLTNASSSNNNNSNSINIITEQLQPQQLKQQHQQQENNNNLENNVNNNNTHHPIACESCRKRHRRCDRILPICSNCKKKKIQCLYHSPKKEYLKNGNFKKNSGLKKTKNYEVTKFKIEKKNFNDLGEVTKITTNNSTISNSHFTKSQQSQQLTTMKKKKNVVTFHNYSPNSSIVNNSHNNNVDNKNTQMNFNILNNLQTKFVINSTSLQNDFTKSQTLQQQQQNNLQNNLQQNNTLQKSIPFSYQFHENSSNNVTFDTTNNTMLSTSHNNYSLHNFTQQPITNFEEEEKDDNNNNQQHYNNTQNNFTQTLQQDNTQQINDNTLQNYSLQNSHANSILITSIYKCTTFDFYEKYIIFGFNIISQKLIDKIITTNLVINYDISHNEKIWKIEMLSLLYIIHSCVSQSQGFIQQSHLSYKRSIEIFCNEEDWLTENLMNNLQEENLFTLQNTLQNNLEENIFCDNAQLFCGNISNQLDNNLYKNFYKNNNNLYKNDIYKNDNDKRRLKQNLILRICRNLLTSFYLLGIAKIETSKKLILETDKILELFSNNFKFNYFCNLNNNENLNNNLKKNNSMFSDLMDKDLALVFRFRIIIGTVFDNVRNLLEHAHYSKNIKSYKNLYNNTQFKFLKDLPNENVCNNICDNICDTNNFCDNVCDNSFTKDNTSNNFYTENISITECITKTSINLKDLPNFIFHNQSLKTLASMHLYSHGEIPKDILQNVTILYNNPLNSVTQNNLQNFVSQKYVNLEKFTIISLILSCIKKELDSYNNPAQITKIESAALASASTNGFLCHTIISLLYELLFLNFNDNIDYNERKNLQNLMYQFCDEFTMNLQKFKNDFLQINVGDIFSTRLAKNLLQKLFNLENYFENHQLMITRLSQENNTTRNLNLQMNWQILFDCLNKINK